VVPPISLADAVSDLTDRQLAARIEAGRMCADLVADGADPETWTPAIEPRGAALEWAIRRAEAHHIFGGTAPWQRVPLIRARRTNGTHSSSRGAA
jgi:hypothetical protein